jgi:alpha-tubulin suppressor-like RCC1 family protein
MYATKVNSTLFPVALGAAFLLLGARQFAQSPGMSITPSNPTIVVGQAQQFTATGAVGPVNVSAGGEYTCVGLSDGTARCAGRNQFGQLGDGSQTNSPFVVTPSGLASVSRVVAGDEFSCALLTDGTASCWGLGEKGQRGDGTVNQVSLVPVSVKGLTNAIATPARCWPIKRCGAGARTRTDSSGIRRAPARPFRSRPSASAA